MRFLEGFIIMHNAIVLEELQGGLILQGLMWSDAIINMLPSSELFIELRDKP